MNSHAHRRRNRGPLVVALLALLAAGGPAPAAEPPKDLRVGKLPVNRVLFLGNSITLHGPAPAIGWTGNWGMAASAADKDYVHLVTDRLEKLANGRPQTRVENVATFERNYDTYDLAKELKDELAFDPDLVIVAIGENVPALKDDTAKQKYAAAFARLLAEFHKDGRRPAVIVRSSFWPDAAKDTIARDACKAIGGTFVDLAAIGKDPANAAKSERKIEHPGVAAHPGDKGMAAIADAIITAVEQAAADR